MGFLTGTRLAPARRAPASAQAPILLAQAAAATDAAPAADAPAADHDETTDEAAPDDADQTAAAGETSSNDAGATDKTPTDDDTTDDATEPATDDDSTTDAPQDLSALATPAAKAKHLWVLTVAGSPPLFMDAALVEKGAFLAGYTPPSAAPGSGEAALLAGQPPNAALEQGCPVYGSLQPRTRTADGVATGSGCLFPRAVKTLADLVVKNGGTARSYVAGQGAAPCRHPAVEAPNPWVAPGDDGFSLVRSPFVLFASTVLGGDCAARVVDLGRLLGDLDADAPTLSWITPDPAALGGLVGAIRQSKAYTDGGVIAVVPVAATSGALFLGADVKAVRNTAAVDAFGPSALLSDLLGVDDLGKPAPQFAASEVIG